MQMQAIKENRGDIRDPHDCVRSHLAENYLHGSLLVRAVMMRGYNDPAFIWHMYSQRWQDHKASMKRDLKRFLCQAVGV